ncbi:MAG TPA: hypothetical protein VFH61_08915 [Thermoleophilia bacterium]|nr:hypothetical protein [Thermoleophilia bacterium]
MKRTALSIAIVAFAWCIMADAASVGTYAISWTSGTIASQAVAAREDGEIVALDCWGVVPVGTDIAIYYEPAYHAGVSNLVGTVAVDSGVGTWYPGASVSVSGTTTFAYTGTPTNSIGGVTNWIGTATVTATDTAQDKRAFISDGGTIWLSGPTNATVRVLIER